MLLVPIIATIIVNSLYALGLREPQDYAYVCITVGIWLTYVGVAALDITGLA